MDRVRINIAIIEPSDVVFEGLSTLLMKSGNHFHVARLDDLNELCTVIMKRNLHIVIMNPVCILNRISEFAKIRNNHPGIMWIGLIYSYFDHELLTRFTDTFSISEPFELLEKKINRQITPIQSGDSRSSSPNVSAMC